ncbi:GNAT family N-acetyltransferase [Luteimonas sp. 22616]|jgi:N-acetylglutamate synthase-like GNAT family acetyltransferase|uniref:GNAT family N-acetyltransferase n=1 Tax=Luteimonas sp. 22616 TaxID=3453951 RepID=UPI003F87C308
MNTTSNRSSQVPEELRWSETLRDRSHVLIRPITKQDKASERDFIEGLSSESKRYRFLGQMSSPSDRMLERFTDIDYVHDMAFVAVVQDDARERIVGVSRYSTDSTGKRCECAVTVSDEWQEKGLGTKLMQHLIEVARMQAVHTMFSVDSAENIAMRDLARFLGFQTRPDPDDAAQVIHELALNVA